MKVLKFLVGAVLFVAGVCLGMQAALAALDFEQTQQLQRTEQVRAIAKERSHD